MQFYWIRFVVLNFVESWVSRAAVRHSLLSNHFILILKFSQIIFFYIQDCIEVDNMCFFLFLNASSERGSKPGVRRSLLSQHSPTLCYLKSVSSICTFRTSSEVSTRKIWMAFLFWIFCANKFENHVGGSFLIGNSSCYSRDLFPNANTGVDRPFSSWSPVFKLIISFQVDHLF